MFPWERVGCGYHILELSRSEQIGFYGKSSTSKEQNKVSFIKMSY